ncbi:MAG: aminotransferase class IV [Eubacteriales bacterium]|jgi:D-alanine transaminase|nr:aminotransferase class IV [Eubacteriales bacterium]
MESIGYYNGTFAPMEQLVIPALDRGLYFGDGVYEALRVERHRFFALQEHLARLRESLALLRIPFSMTNERLTAILQEAADRVDSDSQQIYVQVTRGTAIRTHAFPEGAEANLLIFSRGVALADLQEYRRVIVLPDTRWSHCNIKTLNLIPSVLAAQAAKERGCAEAVFHKGGIVSECSSSNLLLLKDGVLRTAPADERILPGVTRAQFLMLARELSVPVDETAFTLDEMESADELMITSTSAHGLPVGFVDDKPVCGRDEALLRRLQRAYRAHFWDCVAGG